MGDMMITHQQRIDDQKLSFEVTREEIKMLDCYENGVVNDDRRPHLTNLNEDPILNNKIKFMLDKDSTIVGRKTAVPTPDIILGGIGVKENHAIFNRKNDRIFLAPFIVRKGGISQRYGRKDAYIL